MASRSITIKAENVAEQALTAIESLSVPVAKAATEAMKDASVVLKDDARAMIGRAGFSNKWKNAYHVEVYPKGKVSIGAAAVGRFRGISYSDIFATGGRIVGSPMLWIPFKNTPKLDHRKAHSEPKDFFAAGIKLHAIHPSGGRPLLVADVEMNRSQAKRKIVSVTISELKAGKKKSRSHKKKQSLISRSVPLFFGISAVTIRKRFDWNAVLTKVYAVVPRLYDQEIRKLSGK